MFFFHFSRRLIWMLFILFTFGHLFANFCAVRAVRIETFNLTRFHLVVQRFLSNSYDVMTVARANQLEPVLFSEFPSILDVFLLKVSMM